MKLLVSLKNLFAVLPVAVIFSSASLADETEDPRLAQSRQIVSAFATTLQAELKAAMAAGGPAAAIGVCKDVAPAVASRLSREYGASVRRTSLRWRNPANMPGRWERKVLRNFDAKADEAAAAPLEYSEGRRNGRYRYLQAIPTGGVCLACHGATVADDVERTLAREYPHDRARGYSTGDIRGAFSIVWPAQEEADSERPRQ